MERGRLAFAKGLPRSVAVLGTCTEPIYLIKCSKRLLEVGEGISFGFFLPSIYSSLLNIGPRFSIKNQTVPTFPMKVLVGLTLPLLPEKSRDQARPIRDTGIHCKAVTSAPRKQACSFHEGKEEKAATWGEVGLQNLERCNHVFCFY